MCNSKDVRQSRSQPSLLSWESEKHKSWCIPTEGSKGHVVTDGSLLGTAGKWSACGWAVVQLDHDEQMGPLLGMCGSMDAENEVQCTIKEGGVDSFLVPSQTSMWTHQGSCGQHGNN